MNMQSQYVVAETHPKLASLMALQYSVTPAHFNYLEKRLSSATSRDMDVLESLASQITALAGDRLNEICQNYDFICQIVREEELYFRRNGKYRLENFVDANRLVYADTIYMGKYMDGLLLTQIYWSNHTSCYQFYRDVFLGKAKNDYDYLEIGPGHGLLLYQAIADERCRTVTGWDLSQASINHTHEALETLGANGKKPQLVLQDLYETPQIAGSFDCIAFSEVLEHLEDPHGALLRLHQNLKPGGRLFVNVPINSPAPDHLYLLSSPDEAVEAVRKAGFEIEETAFFPMTNHTMQRALKHKLTISACIIGKRAA
jgi:SAM-dependent methyltransferase